MKQIVSMLKQFYSQNSNTQSILHHVSYCFSVFMMTEILNWNLGDVDSSLANVMTFMDSIYAHWHHF